MSTYLWDVTLVNEKREPGKYETVFDGSKLMSGVYFYRLLTGDPSTSSPAHQTDVGRDDRAGSGQSFIQTKKLLLLK
ncbi:MAG: hypothetical protein QME52_07785 [Bacteroidota bacterium]|nr:hypothetical protein [Bacteroidota bacterium]